MISRRIAVPFLLVGLGAVSTACGGEREPVTVDGVTVLIAEPQGAGGEALFTGPLAEVGGCLGIADSIVIFPAGTEVLDGSPLRIDLPELGERGVGDDVELGGGYVYEPSSDGPSGPPEVAGAAIPESCRDRPIFLASPL